MSTDLQDIDDQSTRRFWSLLLASGLASRQDQIDLLRDFLAAYPDRSLRSADNLSQFLVMRKAITVWQAEKLRDGRFKGFFIDHYILAAHMQNETVEHDKWYATYLALDTESNRHVVLRFLRKLGEPARPKCYEVIEDCAGLPKLDSQPDGSQKMDH